MILGTEVGLPQSRRPCVRWGPRPPSNKGPKPPPQFSVRFYCGQPAGCIKMPLGMEVGLIPGDFVLDGDPAPLPKKGAEPPIFRPMLIVVKRLDGSRWPRRLCVRWGPSPSPKGGGAPCPIFGPFLLWPNGCMDRDATGTEVGLGQDDIVLDGVPAPPPKKVAEPHPNFRPIFIVAKWLDASRCHLVWR